jgi:hypothetical protein
MVQNDQTLKVRVNTSVRWPCNAQWVHSVRIHLIYLLYSRRHLERGKCRKNLHTEGTIITLFIFWGNIMLHTLKDRITRFSYFYTFSNSLIVICIFPHATKFSEIFKSVCCQLATTCNVLEKVTSYRINV